MKLTEIILWSSLLLPCSLKKIVETIIYLELAYLRLWSSISWHVCLPNELIWIADKFCNSDTENMYEVSLQVSAKFTFDMFCWLKNRFHFAWGVDKIKYSYEERVKSYVKLTEMILRSSLLLPCLLKLGYMLYQKQNDMHTQLAYSLVKLTCMLTYLKIAWLLLWS